MRAIQASEAKTHFSNILDAVEHGETVIVTRHGQAIARIVPEADFHDNKVSTAIARIMVFRKSMPSIPLEEILTMRHEGHKY